MCMRIYLYISIYIYMYIIHRYVWTHHPRRSWDTIVWDLPTVKPRNRPRQQGRPDTIDLPCREAQVLRCPRGGANQELHSAPIHLQLCADLTDWFHSWAEGLLPDPLACNDQTTTQVGVRGREIVQTQAQVRVRDWKDEAGEDHWSWVVLKGFCFCPSA